MRYGNLSDFYCTQCGQKNLGVWRPGNEKRKSGHLKKIFCVHCGKETNNCEVSPTGAYTKEMFFIEFNRHNFDDNGQRIKTYRQCLADNRKDNNYA